MKLKHIQAALVTGGHYTIMFFSKATNYQQALKDLKRHQENDREENGYNGDWQDIEEPNRFIPDEDGFDSGEQARDAVNALHGGFGLVFRAKLKSGGWVFLTHRGNNSPDRLFIHSEKKDERSAEKELLSYIKKKGLRIKDPWGGNESYYGGNWISTEEIKNESVEGKFETLQAGKDWAKGHIGSVTPAVALQIEKPAGWLFAFDIHK